MIAHKASDMIIVLDITFHLILGIAVTVWLIHFIIDFVYL